jgi:Cu2+-exporting ATPase
MMEAAEQGRARYRRLADRVAAYYSPIIHSLALAVFAGWFLDTGDWHRALTIAISVLIVTCPCALGLAIPMVQVAAAKRLFEHGIALKDGSALERLAQVDTVIFDKTGTLTHGDLRVSEIAIDEPYRAIVMALASRSNHPVARAIAANGGALSGLDLDSFSELPGRGLRPAERPSVSPGRADWALNPGTGESGGFQTVFSVDGELAGHFAFLDVEKTSAREAVAKLDALGLPIELLSGDHIASVSGFANAIGIAHWRAGLLPQHKVERLQALADSQRLTLMVGDGLNDGPALAAAHVSMAPSMPPTSVGRPRILFISARISMVPRAVQIARAARQRVRQNLALSVGYNLLVIPVAMAGYVTPLLAAVAMSLSSISVVANSLRIPAARGSRLSRRAPAPTLVPLAATR